jgi:YVTN family beta-propeller protein
MVREDLITMDGATLLVVNPDSNSLTLGDTATNTPLVEIPVGHAPRTVLCRANTLAENDA